MAAGLSALSAWWAALGTGAAAAGGTAAGSSGLIGLGSTGTLGAAAAGSAGASAATYGATTAGIGATIAAGAKSALVAGAGSIAGQVASEAITKKPKMDLPPVAEKTDLPVPKPKPIEPGGVPTQTNAKMEDERRRMAAGLPKATKNTYAGSKGGVTVQKKRLLGSGTYGRATLGE